MELMTTPQEKASEAASYFECKTRDSGEEFYTLKDGSPEWVTEIVYKAHHGFTDFLPDDWRYKWAFEALEYIGDTQDNTESEDGAAEFADQAVSVYTNERLAWLSSNLNRPSYCDEAAANFGGGDTATDIISMIGQGQYAEAYEVYELVFNALND